MWSSIKLDFSLLWFFCDLLWFFKDLVKIKKKRKIEKPIPSHPQTAQGGYVNGFVSMRRLDGRFCGSERKSRFDSKLRESKKTFFLLFIACRSDYHHGLSWPRPSYSRPRLEVVKDPTFWTRKSKGRALKGPGFNFIQFWTKKFKDFVGLWKGH